MFFDFMHTPGVAPSQASLDLLLSKTRRLRVFAGGSIVDRLLSDEILHQTDAPQAVSSLREAIRIEDGEFGHCMCYGDPTLELIDASDARLALLSIHHGFSVRWRGWATDARLVNGRALMEWLARHGVEAPLAEFEADREREGADRQRWLAWLRLAPSCIQPLELGRFDKDAMRRALEKHYPSGLERALVLLEWYGGATSRWWKQNPGYEELPADLLKTIPVKYLFAAVTAANLSSLQLEGAARLFATWKAQWSARPRPPRLPGLVSKILLEHMLQSPDSDRQATARHAFGQESSR